ncbi:MAG: GlyGly-CTERM sorting domain-containing protein, partial [Nevskia sp.]|nr:GlyGly-CTERM sorting domain-containing protein [Nevskia sp.]
PPRAPGPRSGLYFIWGGPMDLFALGGLGALMLRRRRR